MTRVFVGFGETGFGELGFGEMGFGEKGHNHWYIRTLPAAEFPGHTT